MVLISGMFWCTNDAGFFVLINDYIVYDVGLSEYEAAFGITLLGKKSLKILWLNYRTIVVCSY